MKKIFYLAFLLLTGILFGEDKNPYDKLYNHYFAIGEALANENLADAKKSADDFRNAIAEIEKQTTVGAATKNQLQILTGIAAEFVGAKDLKSTYKPYSEISVVVAEMLSHTRVTALEYFCPMVKKEWLQKTDQKIINPYGGKGMQQCGVRKKA